MNREDRLVEFIHTGLVVRREENADRFFGEILGFAKLEPKILDRQLVKTLFALDRELLVLQYLRDKVHFEVFVDPAYEAPAGQLGHACLKVADLAGVLERCRQAGVKVIRAQKSSGVVTFVSDFDGNLFELKAPA